MQPFENGFQSFEKQYYCHLCVNYKNMNLQKWWCHQNS